MKNNIQENQYYIFFKNLMEINKQNNPEFKNHNFEILMVDKEPYDTHDNKKTLCSILYEDKLVLIKHTYSITEQFTLDKALKIFYNNFIEQHQ